MHNSSSTLNSQLIFGVRISEEFAEIIKEYDLFSFNHDDDIFFTIGDNYILGIVPSHEDSINTKHHILMTFPPHIEQQCLSSFNDTLVELKSEFMEYLNQEAISSDDYNFLLSELKSLKSETPQLFLLSED